MGLHKNRLVVKVGTTSLTNKIGKNDLRSFDQFAYVLADIQNLGYELILVSSGAIAIGANKLQLAAYPESLRMKQAAAAVGQCNIMMLYDKFFRDYGKTVAQILLNDGDLKVAERKENLISTFESLLEIGIIPIVNENDSINCSEIESADKLFGDNDMLSAQVASLCHARKLVIFSDIDGLYSQDPRINSDAQLINQVRSIDPELEALASGAGSKRGRGGMITKLRAAKFAMERGIDTVITNGNNPQSLYKVINNEPVGTVFSGQ
ncbi:glutamate 5-kinase [Enterococcus sp. AZ072]|uniref:glutamate 5-kinase n=1 Tax=unclassified Enterococcus TaxID=2608891 RepID=UPI003D2E910C